MEGLLEEANEEIAAGQRGKAGQESDVEALTLQLDELQGELAMQKVELEAERHAQERGVIERTKLQAMIDARDKEIQEGKAEGNRELSDALAALQNRMEAIAPRWLCFIRGGGTEIVVG